MTTRCKIITASDASAEDYLNQSLVKLLAERSMTEHRLVTRRLLRKHNVLFRAMTKSDGSVNGEKLRCASLALDDLREDARRGGISSLILLDRELLGTDSRILRDCALFPQTATNLTAFSHGWRSSETAIYICISDYCDLFARAHESLLVRRSWQPMGILQRSAIADMPRRWPDLVREMREAFPKSEIVMWQRRATTSVWSSVLGRILDTDPIPSDAIPKPRNDRLSHVEILDLREELSGRVDLDHYVDHRDKSLWMLDDYHPWSNHCQHRLAEAYSRDLEVVAAMDGIDFVG